ncbi:tRNA threonylcarbamoyladenosine dehydratase [Geobacter sulfurreducens]|jgi:tRNA A37 threonylcarbamoyladenosine dehydratase|uniref:YgdL family protein n=1 Tax=Geobacter sulfurreducens (strain ATCC 51573 / DSM 12127 / PCA) TaxID=243231 RepID=Q747H8_GEOSL|nr:tRNA threonylcarbamoyladenosine dehydratase [Geobacter sulfurreducens]AAR36678.1 YgdL family protein [Geobacter sulfurreducens PCA]ADI86040.1 YgdL family protein [Geobacter sulfurreducens KN400]AJY69515.1 thiamine biosynthesis protein ThiF [Geobacter sulfurreducens]UAC03939.1 tRNA threonylcarbamoyladenosine dehydratase [Geobacter sulfurreducens]HCD96691.1 tRNA threonylcarbamoyladenosine dehydratase [Geobacter sulfurreducens]
MSLHRFSRTEILIGPEGLQRLHGSTVAVFGLGGVGSFAAEALCRAGVGRLVLVDFDDICLTNVNRQLHALDGTVGRAKVQVMAERLRLINPQADIVPHKDFYEAANSDFLLSGGHDYVVDAIDHITSKLHLIRSCKERGLPIVSSMGAANKLDPARIRVADIAQTSTCRMAKVVRKLLRKQGIKNGVKVVYSTEEYREQAMPDAGCRSDCICPNKEEQRFSCEHRRTILGSISFIPSIFGLTMAGVVVNDLLEPR